MVFGKDGSVRKEESNYPREKEALEREVVRSFITSLEKAHGVRLTDLSRGEEPGDITCRDGIGELITIQVTEVVDQIDALQWDRRNTYGEKIKTECADVLELFAGCELDVQDVLGTRLLPPLNTKAGAEAFQQLREELHAFGEGVVGKPAGRRYSCTWSIGRNKTEIGALASKYHAASDNIPCDFTFQGCRLYRPGEPRLFLSETIKAKIAKHYDKPEGKFWLLTYATGTLMPAEGEDMARSQHLLSREPHPFDAVWYAYMTPGESGALVRKVWERPAESTEQAF